VSDIYSNIANPVARRRVLASGKKVKAENVPFVPEVDMSCLGSKTPLDESAILVPV